jgi:hypothetical protein
MESSHIQSRLGRTYLASYLVALRWEIFGALGTVGTVLYVLGETFAHIVWSAIAGVTVALLIATFREAMTWLSLDRTSMSFHRNTSRERDQA